MNRPLVLVLALCAGVCAGCLDGRARRTTARAPGSWPFSGPTGSDVVQIDVALVERPFGDAYLNHGVWKYADEQLVRLEQKNLLKDNGLRVGAVGGLPPADLLALLTSPRSCPDPRRIRTRAGQPVLLPLGPARKECTFTTRRGDETSEADLPDARCFLEIVPAPGKEGQVRLTFTPRIKHGRPTVAPRPQTDPSGARRWEWSEAQPEEAYDWLSWELTVSPSEYVVVGTSLDAPDTLGQRCLLPDGGDRRQQRLLVLRAAAVSGVAPLDENLSRVPPLAIQATWSARGYSP